ncbi:hypothetical protein MGG_04009 [Pyricularia oryzae 70-15]|uniref:BZIP domain-containing protein n=3 Tax=Pyricularia oryzae TaxID=318829 RepID=G4NGW4_PYRO7|nr:uncharacterized protein MGG_04009 [Pyricularia oryzae 70-15]EHA47474.1 hypothetical protein MGG_04009 [Pyricularia oryzae 70-15]KAI7920027.1 hypothetical protein M9X92_006082 [Pyricularia oryzae]KAI7932519.1 hypothetical protein M0657_000268 [Pyricularia oryzae]
MKSRSFPDDSLPDMDAGLQPYPNTLPATFGPTNVTQGMPFHPSFEDSTGLVDSGIRQTQVQGDDPYPTVFLEEQAMAQQGMANATAGGLGYGMNPYTIAPPAPLVTAVDPGLLAAASGEKPSISRVPSLTTTNSSGSNASRIPKTGRPQSKSSRSRSSRSISFGATDSPVADPPAKKKKRTQSNATVGSSATRTVRSRKTSPDVDGDDDGKRSTVLERNRVAALKCRKKKKEFVQDLEEQCVELETTNHALHTEAQVLMNELNSMKNHLMDHASCKDPRIDNWLEFETQRFVRESKERAMREQGGVGGGLTYEKLIESVAPTTATASSHRSSLSESMMAASRRSRQGSAGSSQTAGMPVRCRSSHSISESAWNSPMELPVYAIGSAQTSPTVPPFNTMNPLENEEG